MESGSSERPSKLRLIFLYPIWALAELISIAVFVYSAYSVIILIRGNWAGSAVFAGIVPGFVLFIVTLYLCKRATIPWRVGDYKKTCECEYKVQQVRLFHTILENEYYSETLAHTDFGLNELDPIGKKEDGSLVYHHYRAIHFTYHGEHSCMPYIWAMLCELFVLAVIVLSGWFMIKAEMEVSASFLSGLLLPFSGIGSRCCPHSEKDFQSPDGVHVAGLTWAIVEDQGGYYLRHFVLFSLM